MRVAAKVIKGKRVTQRKSETGKRRQSAFGRGFATPHALAGYGGEYYKTVCYNCVLSAVDEEIKQGVYEIQYPASKFKVPFPDDIDLTTALAYDVSLMPDLFTSDNPSARKLVAHFGKKVWQYHHGRTRKERSNAKDDIEKMLFSKHHFAQWSKVSIPPFLSVSGLCDYLHKVTAYLRQQYKSEYEEDTDSKFITSSKFVTSIKIDLKTFDLRLFDLAEDGLIDLLVLNPKELTIKFLANYFEMKPNSLKQYLKEEKNHLKTLGQKTSSV